MYQGRALHEGHLSQRAWMRFLLLNAAEAERVALADFVQAKLMGDPERIDLARRKWLAAEQQLDEAADRSAMADRIARYIEPLTGREAT